MKIVIISNLYEPFARGGAERVVKIQAEGLKARHSVVVVSTKPTAGLEREEKGGLTIYRFRPRNLFYYLDDYKYPALVRLIWHCWDLINPQSARVVKKILQKEKPDLVITHNLKGIGGLIPRVIRKLNLKHIHVLHDVQSAVPSGVILKGQEKSFVNAGVLTRLYARLVRWLFGSPAVVVSPSQWLLDFYKAKKFFAQSKLVHLPNPLADLGTGVLPKEKRTHRFLFFSQLERYKGLAWLLEYWQKEQIKDELWILGRGLLGPNNFPATSKIRWLGAPVQDDLPRVFESVDFLIAPSLCYENAPTVIPFAFSLATPVLAARIGGNAESVNEGKTGFVFEAGDEKSFGQALWRAHGLLDADFQMMSRDCLAKSQEFELQKYLRKLSEFFE